MSDILNKLILLFYILFFSTFAFAQEIIINKDVYSIKNIDTKIIILKNGKNFDTINNFHYYSYQYYNANEIIVWGNNEKENINEGLLYDTDKKTRPQINADIVYLYNKGAIGLIKTEKIFELFYLNGTNIKTIIPINSLTQYYEPSQSAFEICYLDSSTFFVSHFYTVGLKELETEFSLIKNGEVIPLSVPKKIEHFEVLELEKMVTPTKLIFTSTQHQRRLRFIYDIPSGKQELIAGTVETGSLIDKTCIKLPENKTGYVLKKGDIKIVVPFDQSLLFETCLYSIVNQKQIIQEISILPKSEIDLLMQSIYAAHLIEFKDEDLTNFFSCYWFYSLENESVKKKGYLPKSQITLTSTDLYNLKLLQQALKSAPK